MKYLKETQENLDSQNFVLKRVDLIKANDGDLLLSIKEVSANIDQNSGHHFKACVSVLTSALQQGNIYFLLSRKILTDLIVKNKNIPVKHRKAFANKDYKFVLACLLNEYKIIELVAQGKGMKASVFRLKHPESLEYLIDSGIDTVKQKTTILEFFNKKS